MEEWNFKQEPIEDNEGGVIENKESFGEKLFTAVTKITEKLSFVKKDLDNVSPENLDQAKVRSVLKQLRWEMGIFITGMAAYLGVHLYNVEDFNESMDALKGNFENISTRLDQEGNEKIVHLNELISELEEFETKLDSLEGGQ